MYFGRLDVNLWEKLGWWSGEFGKTGVLEEMEGRFLVMEAISSVWGARSYFPATAKKWFFKEREVPPPSAAYYRAQEKKQKELLMAYQSPFTVGRTRKRRRSSGKAFSYAAKRPRAGLKMVAMRQPQQELKFADKVVEMVSSQVRTGNVEIATVNNIADGTGASARIGRKVVIRSIQWKGLVMLSNGNAAASLRVIMGIDKQANGGTAQREDVLATTVGDPTHWFRNLMHVNRFQSVMDKRLVINAMTSDASTPDPVTRNFEFHKKCYLPIEYDGTTGSLDEIASNNLYCDFVSDLTSDPGHVLKSIVRLRFTDG